MDIVKEYQLVELLKEIEQTSDIKVLHSIVIGSHSTGLDRPESKLDILLVYADDISKYFDITDHKQIINVSTDKLNISAFSLKKTIGMVLESNPAIHHLLCGKIKIISIPHIFRQLEQFAKEFYNPQRMYLSLSKACYRHRLELLKTEQKEIKTFLAYVRLSLSLHHCSCYGMIKSNFVELVKQSVLTYESKRTIYNLVEEYKEGKSYTDDKQICDVINEIETLTRETAFNYSLAPIIPVDKVVDFHIKTILDLSKKDSY